MVCLDQARPSATACRTAGKAIDRHRQSSWADLVFMMKKFRTQLGGGGVPVITGTTI
jgi:hypothetical protein